MGSHRLYYGITLVAMGTVAASFTYLAGWEPDSVLARVLVVLGAFTAFAASRIGTWLKADTYPRQPLPGGAHDTGTIPAATLLGTGAYFASGHAASTGGCDAGGQGGGSCDGGGGGCGC